MYDVLIKNGRIVTADAVTEGNIAVKEGKIAAVLTAGEESEAAKVIDAAGKYVFPGAIDTHAHLKDLSGARIMSMVRLPQRSADIPP